jgi:cytochrome b561
MSTAASLRYDAFAKFLHWVIAVLIVFMLVFGEELIDDDAGTTFYATIHVSVGLAILALSVVRLVWRVFNPPPHLPAGMKRWEVMLSKLMHAVFYAAMIGVPLLGWLAFGEFARDEVEMAGTTIFGLVQVPVLTAGQTLDFGELHEIGSNIMIGLLALHVLAALKHHFLDRDGLLWRMI